VDVLVDTSVWSLVLRRSSRVLNPHQTELAQALRRLVDEGSARVIGPVRQEILSGIRDVAQFERLREMLRAFPDVLLEVDDFETAARFSNDCRARGVAGSPVDFLICALASRRKWPIFTLDVDFQHYSRMLPIDLYA
jgi:predicted nucleic acid-binding protein